MLKFDSPFSSPASVKIAAGVVWCLMAKLRHSVPQQRMPRITAAHSRAAIPSHRPTSHRLSELIREARLDQPIENSCPAILLFRFACELHIDRSRGPNSLTSRVRFGGFSKHSNRSPTLVSPKSAIPGRTMSIALSSSLLDTGESEGVRWLSDTPAAPPSFC